MRLLYYSLATALSVYASPDHPAEPTLAPCTIRSPASGAFFDLNSVRIQPEWSSKKGVPADLARNASWSARGFDYGANFTMNFCGPVVENLTHVVGVGEEDWSDVAAFYRLGGKTYSLGKQNSEPVFRGRKLVLNYTDGSPCPDEPSSSPSLSSSSSRPRRRKNSIISLLCSTDPLAPALTLSFVASPDSCTYVFEARTLAACGGVKTATQQISPGGVFGVIVLITVLVYFVGGCVYQRTVMHQRGWRQLPNYSLWAGIAGFVSDMFIIATSSCARYIPGRRGYGRIGGRGSRGSVGSNSQRGRDDSDDENRLIDQLDESWED